VQLRTKHRKQRRTHKNKYTQINTKKHIKHKNNDTQMNNKQLIKINKTYKTQKQENQRKTTNIK